MRSIFVNMPVKDLEKSKAFFETLGFSFNPQFTDETAACMAVEENIYVMLLTRERFAGFVNGQVSNAFEQTEVLTGLDVAGREEVDRVLQTALAAGALPWKPTQDHGFMYSASFQDLDGHVWEVFWMDTTAFPEAG